ncbi:hypothetical protein JGUZn3_02060 [Entomobacter blattae]|uniref:Uncharacterized protein n=1 Tax=Entomobacter blattae TaxID=2762277 RepID=A0A7H1NNV4_9PROT|nr:hypothetical protein JGUZn3_02060 [Entomobacter blattae]
MIVILEKNFPSCLITSPSFSHLTLLHLEKEAYDPQSMPRMYKK